jgi:hypothetical protein
MRFPAEPGVTASYGNCPHAADKAFDFPRETRSILLGILRDYSAEEEDLVATGILGGTVPRGTRDCRSSLGDSPVAPTACPIVLRYPPIQSVTGTKLFRTAIGRRTARVSCEPPQKLFIIPIRDFSEVISHPRQPGANTIIH